MSLQTRLAALVTAIGTDIKDLQTNYLKKTGNGTVATNVTNLIAQFQHASDGSDSSTWSDMLRFSWKTQTNVEKVTSYFNEYGEFRVSPALTNSVPLRVFTKVASGDPNHTGNMIEMQDNRGDRNILWSIDSAGKMTAPAVDIAVPSGPTLKAGYLVLSAAAAVPANTPAGTLIVRTP